MTAVFCVCSTYSGDNMHFHTTMLLDTFQELINSFFTIYLKF